MIRRLPGSPRQQLVYLLVAIIMLVVAALGVSLAAAGGSSGSPLPLEPSETLATTRSGVIAAENAHRGTRGWIIYRDHRANDIRKQVKGYASATSVNKGGRITLYVTTNPAQSYSMDVYRMGYYQGLGGRLMEHIGPRNGVRQPDCPHDPKTGLMACVWAPSYVLRIPRTWTSGVYLVKLTNAAGYQNYIIFVVRDDARKAAILYQEPVTTYQAYNNYPNDGRTGKSLYDFNSFGVKTLTGTTRAVKVSFDRPYADNGLGAGDFLRWEQFTISWLEEKGYDVTYSTDVHTDANPAALLGYRAVISVGHDEYWSNQMYNAWQTARDQGVNLAFFGGNDVYWQIRFEPSAAGVANRVQVCYKDAALDPVHGGATTVRWRAPLVDRPEQTLMGAMFTSEVAHDAYVPYVVTNSSHWIYTNTGFVDGSRVPGIVGYETDRSVSSVPLPAETGYTLLSRSPLTNANKQSDEQNTTIYQAPSGAWVFDAGSDGWAFGLAGARADARIQRTTQNLLDTFVNGGTPPPNGLTAALQGSGKIALTWRNNATNNTGYTVQRSGDGGRTWTTVTDTLPSNAAGYTDTGLHPGTYTYRVRATNDTGASDWSNSASARSTRH
jgi:hypothetical protein